MEGEPGRVDPLFYEMADANVLLENGVGNLEAIGVLLVHGNAIDQLVTIGEALGLEVLFEIHPVILPMLRRCR